MDYVRVAIERSEHLGQLALDRYRSLSRTGKAAVWAYAALHVVFGAAFWIIGPEKIFAWFAGLADQVREMRFGWLLLSAIIVVTSMPPLVGYGTAQTLVGFAFGVMPGFFISAGACLAGGAFAFLLVRRLVNLFAPYIRRDKTFAALSRAVRVKGLPLIILLRLCPFPYPYSNAFFASIETVSFTEFMLATLTITPKLLLHVFIGHRTYLFADPDSRHKMDPTARWINGVFMVVGTVLGGGTSYYLYKLTMRYVEESSEGEEQDALEAGLLQDVDELLGPSGRRDEDDDGISDDAARPPRIYDGTLGGPGAVEAVAGQKAVPEGALLDVGTDEEPTRSSVKGPRLAAAADEEADGWGDAFSDYSGRGQDSVELDSRSGAGGPATKNGGGGGHSRADSLAWGLDDDDKDGGDDTAGQQQGAELEEMQASPALTTKKRLD